MCADRGLGEIVNHSLGLNRRSVNKDRYARCFARSVIAEEDVPPVAVDRQGLLRGDPDRHERGSILRLFRRRRLFLFGLLFFFLWFLFFGLIRCKILRRQIGRSGKLKYFFGIFSFWLLLFFFFGELQVFWSLIHKFDADDPPFSHQIPSAVMLRCIHLRQQSPGRVAEVIVRSGAQHEPAASRKGMIRVVIPSLAQDDMRADIHAEIGPEPGGFTPLRLRLADWEASWLRMRRAVVQCIATAFIEAQSQHKFLGRDRLRRGFA